MPVENLGVFNSAHGVDKFGFRNLKRVHWNLGAPALYEHSLVKGEAQLIQGGAINADTGVHTGRSPKDKFTVRDANTESEVWWDNNGSITPRQFETILEDFLKHAEGKELFAQDLYGGADPAHRGGKSAEHVDAARTRAPSAISCSILPARPRWRTRRQTPTRAVGSPVGRWMPPGPGPVARPPAAGAPASLVAQRTSASA